MENKTISFIEEDKKNEFIHYVKVTEEIEELKKEEFFALIGNVIVTKGKSLEEVKEWIFDNPVKVAIAAFEAIQKNEEKK